MKHSKSLICALMVATLTVPVYAAPSAAKSSQMVRIKEKIDDKHYELAIADLKKILAKDTDNTEAYNLLGFTHRKLKRYEIAEEYYLKALSLEPKHKGALEYLGELYVETDRMDEATNILARLDGACFFSCAEYKTLKRMIEQKKQGAEVSSNW